jgi:hypothetical protein
MGRLRETTKEPQMVQLTTDMMVRMSVELWEYSSERNSVVEMVGKSAACLAVRRVVGTAAQKVDRKEASMVVRTAVNWVVCSAVQTAW